MKNIIKTEKKTEFSSCFSQ